MKKFIYLISSISFIYSTNSCAHHQNNSLQFNDSEMYVTDSQKNVVIKEDLVMIDWKNDEISPPKNFHQW